MNYQSTQVIAQRDDVKSESRTEGKNYLPRVSARIVHYTSNSVFCHLNSVCCLLKLPSTVSYRGAILCFSATGSVGHVRRPVQSYYSVRRYRHLRAKLGMHVFRANAPEKPRRQNRWKSGALASWILDGGLVCQSEFTRTSHNLKRRGWGV